MSRLALFAVIIALAPALAFARETSETRFAYPNASIFAWSGGACPNGSAAIHDSITVEAGRLGGVVHCLFRSPEIAIATNTFCPSGFKRTSNDRCFDQRGRP